MCEGVDILAALVAVYEPALYVCIQVYASEHKSYSTGSLSADQLKSLSVCCVLQLSESVVRK